MKKKLFAIPLSIVMVAGLPACHSTGSGTHGLRHLGRRRTGHV